MAICNRLTGTIRLIRWALLPPRHLHGELPPPAGNYQDLIQPRFFAVVLASLDNYLQPDGNLQLHFADAAAIAAPALLFHLKRHGYSACRVTVTPEGLALSARR